MPDDAASEIIATSFSAFIKRSFSAKFNVSNGMSASDLDSYLTSPLTWSCTTRPVKKFVKLKINFVWFVFTWKWKVILPIFFQRRHQGIIIVHIVIITTCWRYSPISVSDPICKKKISWNQITISFLNINFEEKNSVKSPSICSSIAICWKVSTMSFVF